MAVIQSPWCDMELDLKDAYRITPNLMAGQGSAEPFHLAFARPQRYYCIAGNFRGIIFSWIAIFKHFVEKNLVVTLTVDHTP